MKSSRFLFLIAFTFSINFSNSQNSVLSQGDWYKLSVEQTGIYQIAYVDLLNYGIDPTQINPKQIQLFGNGNGMLPELNSAFRYDDLQENAIFVYGEEDEVFDPEDYILFYGEGPVEWSLNNETGKFEHQVNYYSDKTYYFLTIGTQDGKRIENVAEPTGNPTHTISQSNEYYVHENETYNLIKSGKIWFGEKFDEINTVGFNLSLDGFITEAPVFLKSSFAARCFQNSNMEINIDGTLLNSVVLPSVNPTSTKFAQKKTDTASFVLTNPQFTLDFTFIQSSGSSVAWLDYYELNYHTEIAINGVQTNFRNTSSVGQGNISLFTVGNADASTWVWNVTDPINITGINGLILDDDYEFKIETDSLLEFVAFKGVEFPAPTFEAEVENQNLHGLEAVDYIIVTTEEFKLAAEPLASFHQTQDGFSSEIVQPNQIFNEFSSGAQDVSAIRDFLKYLYDKSEGEYPKYVLLFGDASYDFKDRIENNTNFVPSFQTLESLITSASSVWDDYFTWMDEGEGTSGIPDFAIGRIPAKTADEAQAAVNKIIHYTTNSDFGSWKNSIMFTADDADGNLHLGQADSLTFIIAQNFGELNIQKNYFDFFELSPTPGGPLYPEVTKNINSGIEEGLLILNYTGHGGFHSWGQEQVLTTEDIDEWQNIDRLPLMIAASCQFSVYDDPEIVSGGEMSVLKEDGGCIGIFGQVRLAYSQSNFKVNQLIMGYLGSDGFKTDKRLGDIYQYVKQHTANQITTYSTHLLGDPALKLTFPDYNITTTSVNGIELPAVTDTINPGGQITIAGNILDTEGNPVNNFSGELLVTVYERPYIRQTLGNTNGSFVTDVLILDSIMMQLQAEVINGQFEYAFTLPSGISQEFGTIKLSHYAFSQTEDASGYFNNIVIGGEPNSVTSNFTNGGFRVYPTLVNNNLTLVNSDPSNEVQTQVIDLSGKTLLSRNFTGITKGEKVQIGVSALSPGFYFLRLSSENGVKDFKFIKK